MAARMARIDTRTSTSIMVKPLGACRRRIAQAPARSGATGPRVGGVLRRDLPLPPDAPEGRLDEGDDGLPPEGVREKRDRPAAYPFRLSERSAQAVTKKMTGIAWVAGLALRPWQTAFPSSPGIMKSSRTTSGLCRSARSSPSVPSRASEIQEDEVGPLLRGHCVSEYWR